jgi:predicted nuclease of predicted toxin-antitoxin system
VRLKVDENLPPFVARRLCSAGHDACTVADQGLGGGRDERLAAVCRAEDRVLVTLDKDFSDIRQYPPGSGPGFVVLRPEKQDRSDFASAVALLVEGLATHAVAGNLWIVERSRIRVRDRGSGRDGKGMTGS